MTRARSAGAQAILAAKRKPAAERGTAAVAQMKARQCAKIKQLGQALIEAGFEALDEQAAALRLPRSTAWTILKAGHKSSGLSAAVIERMLASPQLPPRVRKALVEYVEEKSFGLYGGSSRQRHQFAIRMFKTIDRSFPFSNLQGENVKTARPQAQSSAPVRAVAPQLRRYQPAAELDDLFETA